MQTEKSAKLYARNSNPSCNSIPEYEERAFKAGAKFLIDRAYNKERIQMLFEHIVDTTGGMLLENELFHIIDILTSDMYEK